MKVRVEGEDKGRGSCIFPKLFIVTISFQTEGGEVAANDRKLLPAKR